MCYTVSVQLSVTSNSPPLLAILPHNLMMVAGMNLHVPNSMADYLFENHIFLVYGKSSK